MMFLKKVGSFLLNFILTNRTQTIQGGTVQEVEKTSGLLSFNINDVVHGLVLAVITGGLEVVSKYLDSGSLDFDWQVIKHAALVSGVAYLIKKLGTASKTILKLIVIGLLFSVPSYSQTNSSIKALQSWNADSTTVRNLAKMDSVMGRNTGWLYYNNQSGKWRVGIAKSSGIEWVDLEGGGGLTEILGANGVNISGGNTVLLGGNLNQNTRIDGSGLDLTINNGGTFDMLGDGFFTFPFVTSNYGASNVTTLKNDGSSIIMQTGAGIDIQSDEDFNVNASSGIVNLIGGSQQIRIDNTGAMVSNLIGGVPNRLVMSNQNGYISNNPIFTTSLNSASESIIITGDGSTGSEGDLVVGYFNTGIAKGLTTTTNASNLNIAVRAGTSTTGVGGTTSIFSGVGNAGTSGDVVISSQPGASGTGEVRITVSSANTSYLVIQGLPTSSAGLPSGAIWSNAGVLTIVP